MKFQTNKTKLIALLLLLCTVTLMFSSCLWTGGKVHRTIVFYTHDELVEFVEKYNSKNDGSVYTFVSFDFDDNSEIDVFEYQFHTIWTLKRSIITNEEKYADMYDKDHSKGFDFGCEFILYMVDNSAQIICKYGTTEEKFYQHDDINIEFIEKCSFDELANNKEKMHEKYSNYDELLEDFAEKRTLDKNIFEYGNYYAYKYVYQININNIPRVTVNIFTESELNQEKLDEICQLLMDNIVIINTEG